MLSSSSPTRRSLGAILLAGVAALALVAEFGCSANPPYRNLPPTSVPAAADCKATYEQARWDDERGFRNGDVETDRVRQVIQADLAKAKRAHESARCWSSPLEQHLTSDGDPEYDLFSVEFDDQGWLADTVHGKIPSETQLDLLMTRLNRLTQQGAPEGNQPLHIVIFVHGWHHSAAPDDRNVISFRRLLAHASVAERELCRQRRYRLDAADSGNPAVCSENEDAPAWKKKRRVVGIYLGWRGDSVLGRVLENTSIWDRKLAAESLALGSVQEFFARIHSFYQEHDCHTELSRYRNTSKLEKCVDVRILTAGHSFGGLITYRALAPRLMMGIAETGPDHDDNPTIKYAVGFGDLTVLINPAFEATRFEPLAQAAVSREYVDPERHQKNAQLPLLIVATSRTDRATEYAFPIFRRLSTVFERTSGAERSANVRTIGWEERYRTHEIKVDPDPAANICGTTNVMPFAERLGAEAQWSDAQRQAQYAGFDREVLGMCNSLVLSQGNRTWSVHRDGQTLPRYMPIWIVQADKTVVDGHNDFLNDHFVDFIRQVYYTILRDEDEKMDEMRRLAAEQALNASR